MMEKTTRSVSNLDYQIKLFLKKDTEPWLILAICIIIGALLGGILSLFFRPIYEAKALVTTNLELHQDTAMTEIMLDSQINHIGELVYYPDVISRLLETEKSQGNTLTLELLQQKASVERMLMNTIIKVKDPSPELAARIASEWAKILFDRLNEAYPHAVKLSEAKLQFDALTACLTDATKVPQTFCDSLTFDQLNTELEALNKVILEESPYSLGLTLALNVSQYQSAAIPTEPLHNKRGALILSGGGVGLVVGVFLNETPIKHKKAHEN